jgi:hypothetical protein
MKPLTIALLSVLTALLVNQPAAGTPASAPATTQPSALLKQIPADCIGLLIVNDVKGTADATDKFLLNVGVSGFLKEHLQGGLLETAKRVLKLGDGFTGQGSLAVVLLDPKVCGTTFEELSKMKDKDARDSKLPLLAFVPGKDLKSVAPEVDVTTEGQFLRIKDKSGPGGFALERDGYILFAPNEAVLQAVVKLGKSLDSALTKKQIDFIGRNHVAAYGNFQAIRPDLLKATLKAMEESESSQDPASPEAPNKSSMTADEKALFGRIITEWFESMDTVLAGARLDKDGVLAELAVDLNPQSPVAKELKAVKPMKGFDKLPTGQYIYAAANYLPWSYAMGILNISASEKTCRDLVSYATHKAATEPKSGATTQQVETLTKLVTTLTDQYAGHQLAVYYQSQGKELYAADLVIECKDSAKLLQASIKQGLQEIEKSLVGQPIPVVFTVKSVEGVDAAVLDLSPLLKQDVLGQNAACLLGGQEVTLLMTAANDKTLVLTLGGGKDFLDQALKAARGEDTLAKDSYMAQSLKRLPENLLSVSLLNGGALVDTITRGLELMGGHPVPLAVTKVPLAGGTGLTDNTLHQVVFVPNVLIKQSVSSAVMLFLSAPNRPVKINPDPLGRPGN